MENLRIDGDGSSHTGTTMNVSESQTEFGSPGKSLMVPTTFLIVLKECPIFNSQDRSATLVESQDI
jgi:hypothetical protein